jgi:hypothetical protein
LLDILQVPGAAFALLFANIPARHLLAPFTKCSGQWLVASG